MHKIDFGIDAEWHFFATSHGKSTCDGLGGTVKRFATKASLQRQLYDFAKKKKKNSWHKFYILYK